VLRDRAAIFVDGRYTLAVKDQVDLSVFRPVALEEANLESARENLSRGNRLGYDPWLHTPRQVERLAKAAEAVAPSSSQSSEPDRPDLDDRPPRPLGKISLHARKFAGENASRKLARAAAALADKDALW